LDTFLCLFADYIWYLRTVNSAQNREQAKKNKHHPRLGPGGYHGKQATFTKMDEEIEASGDPKKQKMKNLKKYLKQ